MSQGNIIQATLPILSLEQPGRALEAVVYLSSAEGKQVRPGMEVQLTPASVKQEESWPAARPRVVRQPVSGQHLDAAARPGQ